MTTKTKKAVDLSSMLDNLSSDTYGLISSWEQKENSLQAQIQKDKKARSERNWGIGVMLGLIGLVAFFIVYPGALIIFLTVALLIGMLAG